jgi:hypothetical protein
MTNQEKEFLREATIEVLVASRMLPRPVPAIRRNVQRELAFDFTEADQVEALEFLRGRGLVDFQWDSLGSTKWWAATSEGMLHVERSH